MAFLEIRHPDKTFGNVRVVIRPPCRSGLPAGRCFVRGLMAGAVKG